jgi:cutinase
LGSPSAQDILTHPEDRNQAVQGVSAARTKIICHATDNICQGGVIIGAAHLTYGTQNAGEAADFVANAIKN